MNQTIGEKIAMLRKEKQITQTELAEYLFLTPQTSSVRYTAYRLNLQLAGYRIVMV